MGIDGTVASSMRARAILGPENRGRMAGLASRASHADTRAILLGAGWTFAPVFLEVLVNCSGTPKALRLLLMVEGQVLPLLSRLKCMKNGSQNIGIDGIVAAGVGACHPKPSKAQAGWPGWLCERRPRA